MQNKFIKIISFTLLGIIIFIVGAYIGSNRLQEINTPSYDTQQQTASITLDYGTDIPSVFTDVSIGTHTTAFDLLRSVTTEHGIEFSYTDYGRDMGVFINSINGIGSDEDPDRWWQYWVNNQYGTVGVSNYTVQPGDNLLFKRIN